MKETKEISTGFHFVDELKELLSEDDYDGLFERVKKEIRDDDLDDLIQGYAPCFDTRATVMNSTISDGEMSSMTDGHIHVEYELDYYLGCKDMDHTDEDDMVVSISINDQTGLITLTGEDLVEREPDEY